jgi:hypothetical protein
VGLRSLFLFWPMRAAWHLLAVDSFPDGTMLQKQ